MPFTSISYSIFLILVACLGLSSEGRHTGDTSQAFMDMQRVYPGEITTGADRAHVTLIAYVNYECAYCAVLEKEILPTLTSRFVNGGKLKLVHRIFPMSNDLSGNSFLKSEFAVCSAAADRFLSTSATLFNHQQEDFWSHYEKWADASGVEAAADIKSCVAFHKVRHAVISAQQRYAAHDVHVTPTIFINGYKMEGLHPYEAYEAVVMRMLEE